MTDPRSLADYQAAVHAAEATERAACAAIAEARTAADAEVEALARAEGVARRAATIDERAAAEESARLARQRLDAADALVADRAAVAEVARDATMRAAEALRAAHARAHRLRAAVAQLRRGDLPQAGAAVAERRRQLAREEEYVQELEQRIATQAAELAVIEGADIPPTLDAATAKPTPTAPRRPWWG